VSTGSGGDGYFAFEEGHGFGEAFAEADSGFPAEEGAGLGDVGTGRWIVLRERLEAEFAC